MDNNENSHLGYRSQSSLHMTPDGKGSKWARWDQLACPTRLTAAWVRGRHSSLGWKNTPNNTRWEWTMIKQKHAIPTEAWRYIWRYLFFIFFFLGESSSDPFLALPRGPRFSRSPRVSASVANSNIQLQFCWMFMNVSPLPHLLFGALPSVLS